jgi:hypothetical protein
VRPEQWVSNRSPQVRSAMAISDSGVWKPNARQVNSRRDYKRGERKHHRQYNLGGLPEVRTA